MKEKLLYLMLILFVSASVFAQTVGYSEIRFVKTPEKVWQRILIKFLK